MTFVQITWFFIQCLTRWGERLALSSLEITTFATILATLNSLFFWFHKPLDVQIPIVLKTECLIARVLVEGGDRARKPYSRTPLDFLKSPPASTSLVAPFWFALGLLFDLDQESLSRPIKRFGNSKTRPPAGITRRETIYGVVFEFIYFGVHLVAWNQHFPTRLESNLWCISNLILFGLLVLYLITIPIGINFSKPLSRKFLKKEVDTPLEFAAQLPHWAQIAIHVPIIGAYILARFYILLEGLISLRALPLDAYIDISWPNFIPHL